MHPHKFLAFVYHANEHVASYKPFFAEVFPLRIHGIDQCNFLCSQPAFDLFFAFKCNMDGWGSFVIDKKLNVVFAGKTWSEFVFMFMHSPHQIVCYACVKRA